MPDKKFVVSKKCIANDYVMISAKNEEDAIRQVRNGFGRTMRDSVEFISYTDLIPWQAEDITDEKQNKADYKKWLREQTDEERE